MIPSAAQLLSLNTQANGQIAGNTSNNYGSAGSGAGAGIAMAPPAPAGNVAGGGSVDGKVGAGADPENEQSAKPIFTNNTKTDLRVWIEVPNSYRMNNTTKIAGFEKGIIFPYTPQISVEHKAEYTAQTPLHSNYALNFYKNSMVSDISIQAVFTVQNDLDANNYLATVHLLRALTKGRFGNGDTFAGSPPPVCRLHAYGQYMLDNTPVVISSFKQDLAIEVDYYYLSTKTYQTFGEAMVPTKCTLTVTCKPMFSRREMLNIASVPNWLTGNGRKGGIL